MRRARVWRPGATHLASRSRSLTSRVTLAAVHLQTLLNFLLSAHDITDFVAWYYTPMALEFTAHLRPIATVYDCMDELSAFAGAPPGLRDKERALLRRADLVLTGGRSLYEAKRSLHVNVHECPSSVDVPHFARARAATPRSIRSRRHRASTDRVLRRTRRTARSRPSLRRGRAMSRLAVRHGRPRCEDQPR